MEKMLDIYFAGNAIKFNNLNHLFTKYDRKASVCFCSPFQRWRSMRLSDTALHCKNHRYLSPPHPAVHTHHHLFAQRHQCQDDGRTKRSRDAANVEVRLGSSPAGKLLSLCFCDFPAFSVPSPEPEPNVLSS